MRRTDEQAYVEFVEARQHQLRRTAYAVCGDWHRAEDLLQTAFVKLYRHWPRVAANGQPEAYVRRIIVRANVDEHRRPWRRERSTDDLAPFDRGTAEAAVGVEDRSALVDALQQLPQMQRKVVVLRHLLDLSVAETADELGIGEGTVKSHASRGITALRAQLAQV